MRCTQGKAIFLYLSHCTVYLGMHIRAQTAFSCHFALNITSKHTSVQVAVAIHPSTHAIYPHQAEFVINEEVVPQTDSVMSIAERIDHFRREWRFLSLIFHANDVDPSNDWLPDTRGPAGKAALFFSHVLTHSPNHS